MIRSFILLIGLIFFVNQQIFSQNFCQNSKTNSTASALEKYVYKKYTTEKGKEKTLHLGLVRPVDSFPVKKRPLILGVHGGGFINFCPFEPCYVKYSENVLTPNFINQGFLVASVQYRLTSPFDLKPPRIQDDKLKEVHYKAAQDVRDAIKYVFENAGGLGIDAENVFLIGTSAGAITVLHAAYLDNEEATPDLIDRYGKLAKREKIRGVISLSGAIYDLSYLEGGDKIPLMLVHGTEDGIVPFAKGFYLGMKHLTPVYGGKAIYEEAQKKGIKTKAFFYDVGHDMPSRFDKDIFKNANEFVRANLSCAR